MNAVAEDLARKALELAESDRAEIAALILDSLENEPDGENEAAWTAELERRASDLESGAVEGIPWEEVRKRLTSRR
jgi:putative addiction module component (TIGR02574 family)